MANKDILWGIEDPKGNIISETIDTNKGYIYLHFKDMKASHRNYWSFYKNKGYKVKLIKVLDRIH